MNKIKTVHKHATVPVARYKSASSHGTHPVFFENQYAGHLQLIGYNWQCSDQVEYGDLADAIHHEQQLFRQSLLFALELG